MRASVSTVNAPQRECSHFRCACLPGAWQWEMARSSMTYVRRTPDRTTPGLCRDDYPIKQGLHLKCSSWSCSLFVYGQTSQLQPQSSPGSTRSGFPKTRHWTPLPSRSAPRFHPAPSVLLTQDSSTTLKVLSGLHRADHPRCRKPCLYRLKSLADQDLKFDASVQGSAFGGAVIRDRS